MIYSFKDYNGLLTKYRKPWFFVPKSSIFFKGFLQNMHALEMGKLNLKILVIG